MKHKIEFQISASADPTLILLSIENTVLESSNFKDFRNDTFGNAFNVL